MSDLYETDVVTWSDRQADLLRRIAAGERVNDQVDWENVVEEIDAVESLWTQAFLRDLKAEAWPLARDVDNWRADARMFRHQAKRKYWASMRQRIDLRGIYESALAGLPVRERVSAPTGENPRSPESISPDSTQSGHALPTISASWGRTPMPGERPFGDGDDDSDRRGSCTWSEPAG
jgi:hypothetical protein